MTMTARSKKIYFPKDINSKNTNNIKTLFSPHFARINKFKKFFKSKATNTKNNHNNQLYTINNVHIKNNFFEVKYGLKKPIFRRVKTPNSKQFINNKTEKLNKGTNISNDSNEKKNNNYNEMNDEEVLRSTIQNEKIHFHLFNPKKLLGKVFPFKKYYKYNNNNVNKKINRLNIITNSNASRKSFSSKLFIDVNKYDNNIIKRKTNNDYLKKMYIKNTKMDSLNENSIWNEYTKLEKYKKFQQLKNKKKVKEDILNMIKLFRNSYSYKKYNNKTLNKKEKYLNFLDDHSLGLRENIIKNNIQDDRGGKQNLRKIYNPLNV
jgi:hypothetical protein